VSGFLFLDIDGVLNNAAWNRQVAERVHSQAREEAVLAFWATHISPLLVGRLNNLLDAGQQISGEEVKVVLSSTWRYRGLADVQECLKRQGAQFDLWSSTPIRVSITNIPFEDRDPKLHCLDDMLSPATRDTYQRGMEIEQWLLAHVDFADLPSTSIIIVDDSTDFGRLKYPWHLCTVERIGLTEDQSKAAENHFRPLGGILKDPHSFWTPAAAEKLYGPTG